MARHQCVDAINTRQHDRGVFHAVRIVRRPNARMRQRNDQIGPLFADFRHIGLRGLDDVTRLDIAFQMLAVPVHDLRRGKPDHADLDRMRGAVAHGDLAVQNDVRGDQGLIFAGGGTLGLGKVRQNDRELGPGKRFFQKAQAIVEFMVAQRGDIIAQRVERGDDRVHVAVFHAALIGDVIAHRVALQEIAVVDQQRVGGFGADAFDDRRGARQANRVTGAVGVVIIRMDMDMDIRCLHDPQMRLIGRGIGRIGVQRDQGGSGGGAGQELTARQGSFGEGHGTPLVVHTEVCMHLFSDSCMTEHPLNPFQSRHLSLGFPDIPPTALQICLPRRRLRPATGGMA